MSTYEKDDTITEPNAKSKKKRVSILRTSNPFIIVCLIIALMGCLLFSSLFDIDSIKVVGNDKIDADTIIMISGIKNGDNILKTNTSLASQNILKNPWIKSVTISRDYPDTITISVTECDKCAYIKFASNAVAVDNTGKILEIIPLDSAKDYPVISGVTLDDTSGGKMISSTVDKDACQIALSIINQLSKSNTKDMISTINISKYLTIEAVLKNNIIVNFGTGENLEYKIAFLEHCYPEIEDKESGRADLTNPDDGMLFSEDPE